MYDRAGVGGQEVVDVSRFFPNLVVKPYITDDYHEFRMYFDNDPEHFFGIKIHTILPEGGIRDMGIVDLNLGGSYKEIGSFGDLSQLKNALQIMFNGIEAAGQYCDDNSDEIRGFLGIN